MKERYQNNHLAPLALNETVRPFASGSRQTPDPFDFYLDENGFYRKHTARDSSCLFRVISEQIYDIQNYHERVREEVVNFMKENPTLFQQDPKIAGVDFDDYLMDMSKPKGRGGHLELKAAGLLYHANVLIFEPYNRGRYLFKPRKNFNRVIRVFYTALYHYDSVYTKNFIEKAAFCQAIVYEILYEKVFKLPDIRYAVERMLYDPLGKTMMIEETPEETIAVAEDGREFVFDKAENTKCVLGDFKLCHFHNETGFNEEIKKVQANDDNQQSLIRKEIMPNILQMDYFLYDPKISCVRQLLNASIAPLPYKVAKALDTSIYRNIEFDSWADHRRENFKNCFGKGHQLLVGYKCILRRFDSSGEIYDICILKEISKDKRDCLVSVPETGESIFVPYASLKPITKTTTNYTEEVEESYNVHRLSRKFISYNNNKNQELSIKSYKHHKTTTFKRNNVDNCEFEGFDGKREDIIERQMMFNKNTVNTDPKNGDHKPVILQGKDNKHYSKASDEITFLQDGNALHEDQDFKKFLQLNKYEVDGSDNKSHERPDVVNIHIANPKINYCAAKSEKLDGSDLPTDIATLRFFYNKGVETFKNNKTLNHIANAISNFVEPPASVTPSNSMVDMVNSFDNLKTDDNNNTPTNGAPVHHLARTSSNYSNSGYQGNNDYQNRRGGMKRRPFGNNNLGSRGHHSNYHGSSHRNNMGYHQHAGRHGNNNYHHGTVEYSRSHNHDGSSLKGSTTPTTVSQHSSVCHDSGVVVNDSQASVTVDYSTVSSVNVNIQQETQQYPYVTNVYQQQEYDQNNYCVQTPVPYYYPQPGSVPNTPHVMIPTPDINSYLYNPNSAPVDGNGSQLVEPYYQPYMQPYFYSAPVQAPPMGYFAYYPTSPMGYGNVGQAGVVSSPQVAMPNNGNIQQ